MNSPMNTPSVIFIQWSCIVVAISCAVTALWGYYGGWLNIGLIITLAYCEVASLLVAFAAWYCRWYLSDEFVVKTVKWAVEHNIDPEFVEETIRHHPRRMEMRQELERQRSL